MPGILVGVHVGGSPASRALRQGSPHPSLLSSVSDYVIDDKVAVLQKRDHEGFGFVLRGAKGEEGQGLQTARRPPPGLVRRPARPAWGAPPRPSAPLCHDSVRGWECPHARRWFLLRDAQEICCPEPHGGGLCGRVSGELLRGTPGRLLVHRAARLAALAPVTRPSCPLLAAAAYPGVLAKRPPGRPQQRPPSRSSRPRRPSRRCSTWSRWTWRAWPGGPGCAPGTSSSR